jgi:hypothetical protein
MPTLFEHSDRFYHIGMLTSVAGGGGSASREVEELCRQKAAKVQYRHEEVRTEEISSVVGYGIPLVGTPASLSGNHRHLRKNSRRISESESQSENRQEKN